MPYVVFNTLKSDKSTPGSHYACAQEIVLWVNRRGKSCKSVDHQQNREFITRHVAAVILIAGRLMITDFGKCLSTLLLAIGRSLHYNMEKAGLESKSWGCL